MNLTDKSRDEQATLWNGPAGRAWVETQALLDHLFRPFEALLVDAVSARTPGQVLDVGCGTGSTTLAVARQLGADGCATGIDISEPMIAAARARADREGTPARFVCANAQAYAFHPASLDLIVSRFGVMFFDDPVQAFANLRDAARSDAELRLIAWRSAAENPFMTTAERAAAPVLPELPTRRPDGPGQFAFANRDRVRSILDESGWAGIEIEPIDVTCTLPEEDLVLYLTRLGPVALILREADDATRPRVIDTVRAAFDTYVREGKVRFTAACWLIGARSTRNAVRGG
jgi:SAM-dependent methyltransferase